MALWDYASLYIPLLTHTYTCTSPAAAKSNEGSGSGDGANATSPSIIALKILYAPNNTLTQSVMKKANRTFETVDFIQTWSQQVVDCSSIILDNDNFSADSTQVQYMRLVSFGCLATLYST